jgi:hypothetical protein
MKDHDKSKGPLLAELTELRQQLAALEGVETEPTWAEQALRRSESRIPCRVSEGE